MSGIASKNLYDLLGNDPEQDPDREPEPAPQVADNPVARHGKRNAAAEAPAAPAAGGDRPRGGGRRGRGDNVMPLNDRSEQPVEGAREDRPHRGRGRGEHRGRGERGQGRGEGRGGRGFSGRFTRTARDDRSSNTGIADNDKQAAHGWGGQDGNSEWNDEKAGENIAKAEANEEPGFTPDTSAADPAFANGPGAPGEIVDQNAAPEAAEPEDNTKSYDQYLQEQAEKRQALGNSNLTLRQANEGSKQKGPEGNAFSRNPEEENFMAAAGGKAKREKGQQQKKDTLSLDGQYYAPPDAGDRGGRGGRGGRGDRGGRGRGEGRGEFRGGRGGRGRGDRGDFRSAPRGDYRGDRGGSRGAFNTSDSNAFPALGGS